MTQDTKAPERIWPYERRCDRKKNRAEWARVEYVRADLLTAAEARAEAAEAENKRLRKALDHIANGAGEYRSDEIGKAAMDVARATLQEKTDD